APGRRRERSRRSEEGPARLLGRCAIEEWRERRVRELLRARERDPRRAIDLGEPPRLARARRPLELEFVARDGRGVEVGARSPRVHALAAPETHLAERDEGRLGRRDPELLDDLAPRRSERVLPRLQQ